MKQSNYNYGRRLVTEINKVMGTSSAIEARSAIMNLIVKLDGSKGDPRELRHLIEQAWAVQVFIETSFHRAYAKFQLLLDEAVDQVKKAASKVEIMAAKLEAQVEAHMAARIEAVHAVDSLLIEEEPFDVQWEKLLAEEAEQKKLVEQQLRMAQNARRHAFKAAL